MATLPATGYLANSARTEAEMQTALEAQRDFLSQIPASAEVQLTIATGTVTPATRDQGSIKIETEAAAASDDLANIAQTNVSDGGLLLLRASVAGHTVVCKHAAGGAGQMLLQYDIDYSLNATDKWLLLKRVGSDWVEVFRSFGNDPSGERGALAAAALAANSFTGVQRWAKGADVASAAALTLGTDGNYFDITGTTSITSIATLGAGTWVRLHFDGALTLTHHATDLILPSAANITTAAGDEAELVEYAAGDWRCVSYTRASGAPVVPGSITLGTSTATTSGTSIDFTGIPSSAKRITMSLNEVSTNGTSIPLIQLGDSGGIEATAYLSSAGTISSTPGATNFTTGFGLRSGVFATTMFISGTVTFTLEKASTNTWVCSGNLSRSDAANVVSVSGAKSLSATLDRIRLTTVNGTDTFDAGEVNITYE